MSFGGPTPSLREDLFEGDAAISASAATSLELLADARARLGERGQPPQTRAAPISAAALLLRDLSVTDCREACRQARRKG